MAGKIFVNYRRGDVRAEAARLRDKLAATFGDAHVFMDVDNLLAGERFDLKLAEALAGTEVFLAVIGARWMELLQERQASGERDFVREEIAGALAAKIVVIPVVMDRAALPKAEALPEDIRELVLYHKHDIVYESFGRDVTVLIETIETHRRARAEQRARLEAERVAREKAEAEPIRRAAEKQRQDAEAWRHAGEAKKAPGRKPAVLPIVLGVILAVFVIGTVIAYRAIPPAPAGSATFSAVYRTRPPSLPKSAAVEPGQVFKDCPDCPEMVVVPAGSFIMGAPENEMGYHSETQHKVTFEKPFAVGRFAVTRDQFEAFVKDSGYEAESGCLVSKSRWNYPDSANFWNSPGFSQTGAHPVVCVSWSDAKAYVTWLAKKTGKAYRLLSEAEREYVTRAGTTTPYWWGLSITPEQANYNGRIVQTYKVDEWRKTVPVRSFQPNPWGLYQVHGNVWEWVEDCSHGNYLGAPSDGSAWIAGACDSRAARGGSYVDVAEMLRSARRFVVNPIHPTSASDHVGLRVATTFTH